MSTYAEQRRALMAASPMFAGLMPEECPAPPPIERLSRADVRRLLLEPANNHAEMLLVLGWGDGSIPRAIVADPILRQKRSLVLVLEGELDAFAASFADDLLPGLKRGNVVLSLLRREEDAVAFPRQVFGEHASIPPLAGCDIVDSHPLAPAAAENRARWRDVLMTGLSDRPPSFGNDIGDSFTGLWQCALNARSLLPAPHDGLLRGFYGDVPAISIAAGPSLKRHIPRLRDLQDRCLLVACDAVLHGLLAEGIVPHFVTPLERLKDTAKMVAQVGDARTVFAGLPVCNPDTLAPFGDRVVCTTAGDQVYDWLFPGRKHALMAGSSSGVLSVSVAANLTRGPVYLVGHDLSRDGDASHWNAAGFAADSWKKVKGDKKGPIWQGGYEDRLVPGNAGGVVPSITWWDRFRNEIGLIATMIARSGRAAINVNAHDRVGAVIGSTIAGPLPDPSALAPMPDRPLPARDESRLRQWQERARRLPADTDAFRAHLRRLREDIAGARGSSPMAWPIDEFCARAGITDCVSEGNRAAFAYFLRSALHNSLCDLHRRRRTPSLARLRWQALDSIDAFAHSLDNALASLEAPLKEIADVHAA